ncbi:MAG: hypothetical protein QGG67_09525 [Gammaproteobacteria bacterium]|jgi:hypothetical protein|nr:hypothetical protein [Gammaproteobacteria bacterium]
MNASNQNKIDLIEQTRLVELNIENLSKGVDNYHIDVKLSRKFCSISKKLITLLVSQQARPNPKNWDNSSLFKKLQDSYLDMMTVLIHRVKTDLGPEEISFLQLAVSKFILLSVKAQLDHDVARVTSRLAELKSKGSSETLAVDQRKFWLKKNYDTILYGINKQIFSNLQRTEEKQLATIRSKYLPNYYNFAVELIFNPLLYSSELSALPMLMGNYSAWDLNGNDTGFTELNEAVEKLFAKKLKKLPVFPLKNIVPDELTDVEITDEMEGLFASQSFLGLARDCQEVIAEHFFWFDLPSNIELLFNTQQNQKNLSEIRKTLGIKAWWNYRKDVVRFKRTLKAFHRLLKSRKLLNQLLASRCVRNSVSPTIKGSVEPKTLCQYLSCHIDLGKLQDSLGNGQRLNNSQVKSLDKHRENIQQALASTNLEETLELLKDVSRYRLHLKYFRFAHRVFNQISLLTDKQELLLSKEAGTLYSLPTSTEIEDDDDRICHHAIMKADVRGSTTVTDELQNRGLNPASYFSMRFFKPINKILDSYGANKVFIEGDAIILSFLEHEQSPQQWFAVSRACGYSREMLKIVGANNRHSAQMDLPFLELGVGICYASESPRYLYDEDKPIMISSAIGLADRLSSCSWALRSSVKRGLFNVDVARIADGGGEKGQQYVRYNVNGILLDNIAFNKLKSEISLKCVKMKLNGEQYCFYIGQYPDTHGRKKELIIREGKVGIWKDSAVVKNIESGERYYEVVVNRKVLTLVMEAYSQNQTALAF